MCETAREESGGKVSILGYVAGDEIMLPSDIKFPAGFSFAFVFVLKDGSGKFKPTFEIRDSSGNNIIPLQPLSELVKPLGKAANILVNIPMLVVPSFGTYSITMSIEGVSYTRKLTIKPQ